MPIVAIYRVNTSSGICSSNKTNKNMILLHMIYKIHLRKMAVMYIEVGLGVYSSVAIMCCFFLGIYDDDQEIITLSRSDFGKLTKLLFYLV